MIEIDIDDLLTRARKLEGRRRSRLLQRRDLEALRDAINAHPTPVRYARVYAEHGSFVPNSYSKAMAPITVAEFDGDRVGLRVLDARRSGGRGPWVTINNRAV